MSMEIEAIARFAIFIGSRVEEREERWPDLQMVFMRRMTGAERPPRVSKINAFIWRSGYFSKTILLSQVHV